MLNLTVNTGQDSLQLL